MRDYIKENGISPSFRDVMRKRHLASTCTVQAHFKHLQQAGAIDVRDGVPRSVRVLWAKPTEAPEDHLKMAWGAWRVPEITEEVEFRLKVQELEVREMFKRNPEAVLRQALLLAREAAMLERIVEKAGKRITELETEAALVPPEARFRPWWS